jgi:hypothetical protein
MTALDASMVGKRQEQSNRRTVSYAEVPNIKAVNPSGGSGDN